MSIVANNIQYSNGNIQTCTLVIDSKAFQIQYQDGSYKVSSSGEASGESNTSSSANVGPVASGASGSSTSVNTSGSNISGSSTSGSNISGSNTLENTTQEASETLEQETTTKVPNGIANRRVNTRKLSAIFKNDKVK